MKAKFIRENIEFKRAGSDSEILDRVLDRIPPGTLYFDGGRFPYLWMLVGMTPGNKDQARFANLGHFRGGGRRKTEFRFVSNGGLYNREFRYLKPVTEKPKQWQMVKDVADNSAWGPESRWEWVTKDYGAKPILPVFESNFERAKSERDIKSSLFGYRVGQLVTPREMVSEITQPIGIVNEIFPEGGST